MAFFGVTVEKLSEVRPHTNADRLAIAKMEGLAFQFVVPKDTYKVGDKVLYFPIDSLIPTEILSKMGLEGKLSGPLRNRVKTIKLRGEISQGIVASPDVVLPDGAQFSTNEEMTQLLGVTKYEPPITMDKSGNLKPLPPGLSKYDIEGADRYGHIVDILMDKEVIVMEKLEGTNFSACQVNGQFSVNQRNFSIEELPGHDNMYWKAARNANLQNIIGANARDFAVYAELCGPGIQGNIYGLTHQTLFIFDFKTGDQWAGVDEYMTLITEHCKRVAAVPILFRGTLRDFLAGRTIQEASNGYSVVNPEILREGIVVKPVIEQFHPEIGRLIIKQRSPQYLAGSEN